MSFERFGSFGIWQRHTSTSATVAAKIEDLGFGTLWVGGSPPGDLQMLEPLLEATETLTVASGIVNIWTTDAATVAQSFRRIDGRYPGRFVLGIGAGHREATKAHHKPLEALERFLDQLDDEGVGKEKRILAALGPRALTLAGNRALGAHPYLTTPAHTRDARQVLQAALLAPEQKVVLESDAARARSLARPSVAEPYLRLQNYITNLKRLGYQEADIINGGSDDLIDALVAHGSLDTITDRLREHIQAGADHVAVHLLSRPEDSVRHYEALASALGITRR